jgi:DNA-binding NarL/FixJ family response regulator
MARIFLVDDHPLMRQSYALLIAADPTLEICGEAGSGREALAQILHCAPDAVVIDISLAGEMSGIDLLKQLQVLRADLPVLIVSGHEESMYAKRILGLGARGYLMKDQLEAFLPALHRILNAAT